MIIKMTKSCPHNVDTIVTFTKFDTAPKFTCPTLQKTYDEYYGNDDTSLKAGEITSLYFWYVHNLNEKNNPDVQTEMNTLQVSAQRLVDSFCQEFPVNFRLLLQN